MSWFVRLLLSLLFALATTAGDGAAGVALHARGEESTIRYIRTLRMSEQRAARINSFMQLVYLAKFTDRVLVEPKDNLINSSVFDYPAVMQAVNVSWIPLSDFEPVYARLMKEQEQRGHDANVHRVYFNNCKEGQICFACQEHQVKIRSWDDYLAASGVFGSTLAGPAAVVEIDYYKRCGRRDSYLFPEYNPLLRGTDPVANDLKVIFKYTREHIDETVKELRALGITVPRYAAIQMRTEKWHPDTHKPGSDYRVCIQALIDAVTDIMSSAQGKGIDVLYLSADVMPGKKPRSSTLRNADPARLRVYEDMVSTIVGNMGELGVRVITFDDLSYGTLLENDPKMYYFKHGTVDQIAAQYASIFIATGKAGALTPGYDTINGIDFGPAGLVGPYACVKSRHVTGSYGSWIVYNRDWIGARKFVLQHHRRSKVAPTVYNRTWMDFFKPDESSVTIVI